MKPALRAELAEVVHDVVAPAAAEVDADAVFPRAGLAALARIGVLGLPVAPSHGGLGLGLADAAEVVQTVATACGSTAMVLLAHLTAAAVLDRLGSDELRVELGSGRHLSTLALSDAAPGSEVWSPVSTAVTVDGGVALDATKSWVTAGAEADSYVWSSRPVASEGRATLWSVRSGLPGLSAPTSFDGLGLRGNRSVPVTADHVEIPLEARLGPDGGDRTVLRELAMPWFLVLGAAFFVGLMEAVVAETGEYLRSTRAEPGGPSLAEAVRFTRVDHARMRVSTDLVAALLRDTTATLEAGADVPVLRVLEIKAAAGDAAIQVTDLALTVCGSAAFRSELGVERRFRDVRAARLMAPTREALLDVVGREVNGLPWP